jgi:hypothetical protein
VRMPIVSSIALPTTSLVRYCRQEEGMTYSSSSS